MHFCCSACPEVLSFLNSFRWATSASKLLKFSGVKRSSSVLGGGGIFAYLGFISGRLMVYGESVLLCHFFKPFQTMSRLRRWKEYCKTSRFSNTHFPFKIGWRACNFKFDCVVFTHKKNLPLNCWFG